MYITNEPNIRNEQYAEMPDSNPLFLTKRNKDGLLYSLLQMSVVGLSTPFLSAVGLYRNLNQATSCLEGGKKPWNCHKIGAVKKSLICPEFLA